MGNRNSSEKTPNSKSDKLIPEWVPTKTAENNESAKRLPRNIPRASGRHKGRARRKNPKANAAKNPLAQLLRLELS